MVPATRQFSEELSTFDRGSRFYSLALKPLLQANLSLLGPVHVIHGRRQISSTHYISSSSSDSVVYAASAAMIVETND
jgi:hypothetical protein